MVTLGNNNYNIEIMMKRYWQNYLLPSLTRRGLGVGLLLALLAFTACSSDDDKKVDDLTVQQLAGLWAADYAENKTEGDLHWTRVVADYLFRADGTGYYECFLLDGDNYVGAESARGEDGEGDFHYTISGNTVTITIDKTGEKWTMTYADGKLSDPERTAFQKATTAQQTLVEQLYGEWQKANSGKFDDDTTIKTDIKDSYTDEVARAPKRM